VLDSPEAPVSDACYRAVAETVCYRLVSTAFDDMTMWRNFVALLPYTVHVDHDRERALERARRLRTLPRQRPRPRQGGHL
jgi:hypothetical protein